MPSTNEMWVRWMMETGERKRLERIRLQREAEAARPRRGRKRPGRRVERAGRRPRVRA